MKIFAVNSEIPAEAVEALRAGEIVCYPTETYYALGIDYRNESARLKLYHAKQRPGEKELPLIASDRTMVSQLCNTDDVRLGKLADLYWPGPLTIVLPSREGASSYAIRISSHPVASGLAKLFGAPVVSTSANLSGEPPVRDPSQLADSVRQNVSVLLDGGICSGNLPSTIISLLENPGKILREGAISTAELLSLL